MGQRAIDDIVKLLASFMRSPTCRSDRIIRAGMKVFILSGKLLSKEENFKDCTENPEP
jgi:hypothetical protein